jgi:hypothetical protein
METVQKYGEVQKIPMTIHTVVEKVDVRLDGSIQ